MLPVVMLKARATSRIIFAIGGVSCRKTPCLHVGRVCGHSILNEDVGIGRHRRPVVNALAKAGVRLTDNGSGRLVGPGKQAMAAMNLSQVVTRNLGLWSAFLGTPNPVVG
jgi:hypothetical protein